MTEESSPRSLPGDPRAWIVVGTIVAAGLMIAVGLILRFISEGEPAQVLRVALPTFGAEVVDPSADNQAGQQYYGHLFDYMLGANPNGTPSAELGAIESWTSDADAGQYTLNLRRGSDVARWNGGDRGRRQVQPGALRAGLSRLCRVRGPGRGHGAHHQRGPLHAQRRSP